MPLWRIYYTPNVFPDKADKLAIATAARDLYVSVGLPAYYVHTLFVPMPEDEYFHLSSPKSPTSGTVLLGIDHIARQSDPKNVQRNTGFKDRVDKIMAPYTTDRGFHLEFAVMEGPAYLWRIDGIDPPEAFGPEDKEQAEASRLKLDAIQAKKH